MSASLPPDNQADPAPAPGAGGELPAPEGQGGREGGLLVRLPIFEGPLDLLLHLIRKQQIDIRDIPIVLITEQYIDYLNLMKELNLDLAGEYLVMAATLIHIKSKMLLPVEPGSEGEEAEDPRAELVRQLLEYEKFKRVADVLYERERIEGASHPRGGPSEFEIEEETLYEASLFDLVAAFKELLEERQQRRPLTLETSRFSVTEKVAELLEVLGTTPMLGLRDLFDAGASRADWIVTFLAVLELARLGAIRVLQRRSFGDIFVVRREREAGAVDAAAGPGAGPIRPADRGEGPRDEPGEPAEGPAEEVSEG